MTKKFTIDTSFASAFLLIHDPRHKAAIALYEACDKDTLFIIPSITLIELQFLKKKLFGAQLFIEEFIAEIDHKIEYYDEDFLLDFRYFMIDHSSKLKPNDTTVLFTAIRNESELLTFDEILSAEFKRVQKEIKNLNSP